MRFRVVLIVATLMVALVAPAASAAARTTLTITAELADAKYSWKLTCDPLGGNHPNKAAACALLKKKGTTLFAPIPDGAVCTEIYGGPEKVRVTGSVRGKKVNTLFVRINGCHIARYDKIAPLVTIPNTQVIRGTVTLDGQPADDAVIFVGTGTPRTVRSTAGAFIVRLPIGTWLGSSGAGVACTAVTVEVTGEGEQPTPVISCRSTSTG